jgi:DNA polymerase III subunit delta
MPSATENAFKKAITARTFAPVYLLYGADEYRKHEAVVQALAAAVAPEVRDFNVEIRSAPELDAEVMESLLGTPPLAATRRAVVIDGVGDLKKDARRALDRYLANPASDTLLLLVAVADGKPDRVLLDRAVSVEFEALAGDKVPKWIAKRAADLGAAITDSASALLQQAAGPEPAALAPELDKLVSYARGMAWSSSPSRPGARDRVAEAAPVVIDDAAVAAIVGVRRGETLTDLLDRVAERDAAGALALVEHVLSQPKTGAVPTVMALTVQTLALGWGRARRDSGVSVQRLNGEYLTLLKETKAYPWRPWSDAIATWVRTVDRWDIQAIDRAVDALLAAELALKDTRTSSDEHIISTLVLAMCVDANTRATPVNGARAVAAA